MSQEGFLSSGFVCAEGMHAFVFLSVAVPAVGKFSCVSVCGYDFSICSTFLCLACMCCQIGEGFFFCLVFFLVIFCFVYFHVFSKVAVCWVLQDTVRLTYRKTEKSVFSEISYTVYVWFMCDFTFMACFNTVCVLRGCVFISFYASMLSTAVAGRTLFSGCLSARPILLMISQEHLEGICSNLPQTFTWTQGWTD